jgi:hypothetical protein
MVDPPAMALGNPTVPLMVPSLMTTDACVQVSDIVRARMYACILFISPLRASVHVDRNEESQILCRRGRNREGYTERTAVEHHRTRAVVDPSTGGARHAGHAVADSWSEADTGRDDYVESHRYRRL